jgi:hypothetical protein
MYVAPLTIHINSNGDLPSLRGLLKSQAPQLSWDAGMRVSLSPSIQFQIEVSNDSYGYDEYPFVAELYYVSGPGEDDERVIADQKQIVQVFLDCFKKQGWQTTVASPHYTDEDFA